ncbi:methyltransferase [Eikenella sp. S3360]|uniref:Methyltransferase n=1 Tax=Eikenella glucosivorans TaxID=2766967 RepID=A0ABS0NB35_9NEIS|nr:methyltransferase domain-containing protein [Eikenella glucosivorans]MBH5329487.1 methyltransferase [Eikenella glucosivorans]
MIEEFRLAAWLDETAPGGYLKKLEQEFFSGQLDDGCGLAVAASFAEWGCWPERVLRLGRDTGAAEVRCALPQLPLASGSVRVLLLPHGLELCGRPQELLLECFRVLAPYGRLVLSGFNPYSLWRLGLPEKDLGLRRNALPLPQVRKLLDKTGFRPELGRFMAYVPPFAGEGALRRWRFMELAGNRWWPTAAAVYGLVAVKTVYPLTPLPEKAGRLREEGGLSLLPGNCRQGRTG